MFAAGRPRTKHSGPVATELIEPGPTTGREIPTPRRSLVRPAAGAAVCGGALLAARVGAATGRLDDGPIGSLVARLDAAAVVLLVLGVTMAATPVVGRLLAGRPAPSWRRYYARWLLPLYALWVPVVLLNEIVVDPRRGTRALLESLILFRDVGERPVTGLGIGALLTMLAMTVALLPLADRAVRRWREHIELATVLRLAGLLVVAGIVVRTALVLTDRTAPFGPLSWLPAHLDAVGAGVAIAALQTSGQLERRRIAKWSLCAAAVALLAATIALPRTVILTGGGDVWLRGVLYLIVAAGVRDRPGVVGGPGWSPRSCPRRHGAGVGAHPRDGVHRARPAAPRSRQRRPARPAADCTAAPDLAVVGDRRGCDRGAAHRGRARPAAPLDHRPLAP